MNGARCRCPVMTCGSWPGPAASTSPSSSRDRQPPARGRFVIACRVRARSGRHTQHRRRHRPTPPRRRRATSGVGTSVVSRRSSLAHAFRAQPGAQRPGHLARGQAKAIEARIASSWPSMPRSSPLAGDGVDRRLGRHRRPGRWRRRRHRALRRTALRHAHRAVDRHSRRRAECRAGGHVTAITVSATTIRAPARHRVRALPLEVLAQQPGADFTIPPAPGTVEIVDQRLCRWRRIRRPDLRLGPDRLRHRGAANTGRRHERASHRRRHPRLHRPLDFRVDGVAGSDVDATPPEAARRRPRPPVLGDSVIGTWDRPCCRTRSTTHIELRRPELGAPQDRADTGSEDVEHEQITTTPTSPMFAPASLPVAHQPDPNAVSSGSSSTGTYDAAPDPYPTPHRHPRRSPTRWHPATRRPR